MSNSSPDELQVPWLLGFSGREPSPEFLRLCRRHPPAALILFRDNLARGAASLLPLHQRIEEAAGRSLPLFLDEEGGWIQATGVRPSWPSPRAQALDGVETVERVHRAMAARACHMGVEVLCTPVADLDDGGENPVIGSRCFGADAEKATHCVAAVPARTSARIVTKNTVRITNSSSRRVLNQVKLNFEWFPYVPYHLSRTIFFFKVSFPARRTEK